MRKDEWLKLYRTEQEPDEKTGKIKSVTRYIGPWYTVEKKTAKRAAICLWAGLVLSLGAFLTAGLIPTWASMCAYVAPWYILCLLPLFYLAMSTVKITRMKEQITEPQRAEGPLSARRSSLGLALLGGAWTLADVIFLLSGSYVMTMTSELIFLSCGVITTAAGVVMSVAASNIKLHQT